MQTEMETVITEIIRRTPNVKSFRFENTEEISFKAGQFLSLSLGSTKDMMRWLSISNSPTEKGYLEVTKKITESEFSKKLDSAMVGMKVKIKYPFGNFVYNEADRKIAFLSGGIGITPIRSMMKYIADSDLCTSVSLVYSNHSSKDIAFKDDIDAMVKANRNWRVVYVLCQVDPNLPSRVGYINKEIVKNDIPDYKERRFFLCGPPKMVEAMENILGNELGLPKENIVKENFVGY